MSAYEQKRWEELQAHWEKKAKGRRQVLPAPARNALDTALKASRNTASKAGRAVADRTPDGMKELGSGTVDAVLVPTLHNVVSLLELLNDWVVELTDPASALAYHLEKGREVSTLEDLRSLDLEELEELTKRMALRWRTIGAGEGAALGSLAMIPVPVLGSAAAIGVVQLRRLSRRACSKAPARTARRCTKQRCRQLQARSQPRVQPGISPLHASATDPPPALRPHYDALRTPAVPEFTTLASAEVGYCEGTAYLSSSGSLTARASSDASPAASLSCSARSRNSCVSK
jgi:hypothetical protein